ncbi:hypothetical protein C1X30_29820, partial [Pseudomonas sp. FW305-BF6]
MADRRRHLIFSPGNALPFYHMHIQSGDNHVPHYRPEFYRRSAQRRRQYHRQECGCQHGGD